MEADRRTVKRLCEGALAGEELSRDEIVLLLGLKDVETLEILRQAAEEGLRRWVGTDVDMLFRLPISSYCEHNCLYCDLRKSNVSITRFRLTPEQILESLDELKRLEFGTVVIDGAEDPDLDVSYIEPVVGTLLDGSPGQGAPVFCLGERDESYYERLRSMGVERYILDHKTASPILYNELHPERDFFDRIQCIKTLLNLGFSVGTALSVGLPHQDLWDLTDDLMQIRELGLDTVIVGPFIPGPSSPMSESPRGSVQASLNALAVARLVLKDAVIPGALSFDWLDKGSVVEALRWGADCVICNVQPPCSEVRSEENEPLSARLEPVSRSITTRIRSLGRSIGTGRRVGYHS